MVINVVSSKPKNQDLSGNTFLGESDEFWRSDGNFARLIISLDKIIKVSLYHFYPSM